jgi:hypothetical protein
MDSTPRWRGLNHFSAIMKVDFTDGRKYEDISKVSYSHGGLQTLHNKSCSFNNDINIGHYICSI